MEVDYIYCSSCGCEDYDLTVAYSRTTADGNWFLCPECGEETSNVEVSE